MFFYKPEATTEDARFQAELLATTANIFADFTTNANQNSRRDFNILCDMVTQLAVMCNELCATLEVATGFADSKEQYYNQYGK